MNNADYTYRAFINADRAAVWDAITNPDKTERYFYDTRVDCDWVAGAAMDYFHAESGVHVSTGSVVTIDAPARYECMFHALWDPELQAEGPVREVWTLDEINGMVELTVELFDVPPGSKTGRDFATGLPYIISGLKSVVETGKGLPPPY